MSVTQLDVFTQPKPSSPSAKWARWIATDQGRELFAEIERRALACWRRGDRRVEVNRIVADVRAERRVRLDNSIRAPLADALVQRWPVLADLIERRKRKAAS